MIRLNKATLRDKIYACWLGKNIGGTMGTPFEGKRELNDIQGFNSPEGSALPNDDLDLQLVWLRAMDEQGLDAINSKVLGEYWINYIGPHWNEYGVCKANMRAGILPPLSGQMNNEEWRNSNGAWIRTEIWACTHPACPEKAIRCAFEDASVDHGFGEGSYAAIFVAAMESAAFVLNDLRALIRIGLSKITADCRVARSVRLVIDAFDNGIDWKTARNRIVEDSADLGWFQAPANIAFTVLGLLYGGGDFKKSMILAINCGDDTDCTGATLGSLMGIMGGTAIIPQDWRNYIGDGIVTVAIVRGTGFFPRSCGELTDCVMRMIPAASRTSMAQACTKGEALVLTDEPDDFGGVTEADFCGDAFVRELQSRSPYSFTIEGTFSTVLIEYDREPIVVDNGTLSCKVTVKNAPIFSKQNHFELRWFLPEGWHVQGPHQLFAAAPGSAHVFRATGEVTLQAGDSVQAVNRLILEVRCPDHALPILVPVTVLG